jgi:hypothetical protein
MIYIQGSERLWYYGVANAACVEPRQVTAFVRHHRPDYSVYSVHVRKRRLLCRRLV